MRIAAISDLHGNLIDNIEPCELVFICGDIVPLKIQWDILESKTWLATVFNDWVNELPCQRVVFIAGNHDIVFSREYCGDLLPVKAKYLENSYYDYLSDEGKVYRIYGTPNCHIFGNWAFMYSDEALEEIYSKIPDNCDVLLSHDAPYGISDICFESIYNGEKHLGNPPLYKAISDKSPKYCLHGHLHSSNHQLELLNDTKVYNTSIVNESYRVAYEPLYLDI